MTQSYTQAAHSLDVISKIYADKSQKCLHWGWHSIKMWYHWYI